MRKLLKGSFVLLLLAVAACDGSSPTSSVAANATPRMSGGGGGSTPGGSSITLLTASSGAPAINSPTSFYAVQGLDRQGELSYVDSSSGNTVRKFLRLRIRPRTQIARPDGTLLATGDSILITITLIDRVHLIAQFEPSGLRFSGKDPAELTMFFGETNPDLNHDGVVNAADAAIVQTFSIFRQAFAGAPWTRIPSTVSAGADEVTAAIPGFSNYVIAY